jgi:hypothetical protein
MQLDKSQIESVRNQLKKAGDTASNEEIRQAAEAFDTFDSTAIAMEITRRKSSMTTTSHNNQGSLSKVPTSPASAITKPSEQDVKREIAFQAVELGIQLNQSKLAEIAVQLQQSIVNRDDLITAVTAYLREYVSSEVARLDALAVTEFTSIKKEASRLLTEHDELVESGLDSILSDLKSANSKTLSVAEIMQAAIGRAKFGGVPGV